VVLARRFRIEGAEKYAEFAPGTATKFAVAVWEGSNGERAGIKAFSVDWRGLELAPAA
jgi:hypothetical protein